MHVCRRGITSDACSYPLNLGVGKWRIARSLVELPKVQRYCICVHSSFTESSRDGCEGGVSFALMDPAPIAIAVLSLFAPYQSE